MANEQVLDREAALERLGGDDELYQDILAIFMEDTPEQLTVLAAAIAERNEAVMVRQAHSVKGSALNIGADQMANTAARMEVAARAGDLDEVTALMASIQSQLDAVKLAL